jgi:hypothetical protein
LPAAPYIQLLDCLETSAAKLTLSKLNHTFYHFPTYRTVSPGSLVSSKIDVEFSSDFIFQLIQRLVYLYRVTIWRISYGASPCKWWKN